MPVKKPFSKTKLKTLKALLTKKEDEFDFQREKQKKEDYEIYQWDGMPNPIQVVRDFIMEKGLKLYGGQALHEHLVKHKAGFYGKHEFPDYDVFSPDAWNHARELADRLYKMGFYFTEARSSILNDEHHQTYKVSVDLLPILDLTQVGCTARQLKNKDCEKCGQGLDGKCMSIFNHIPCNNLINYNPRKVKNPKTYTETYDYKTNKAIHPKKMFVCDPTWLKISMYRELTEPLSNPARLPKVGKRLEIFEHYFETDIKTCSDINYKREVHEDIKPVLKYIGEYVKKNKLINYGATAYNLFVKGKKNLGNLSISDYQVYSSSSKDGEVVMLELLELLPKKFPKLKFSKQEVINYWKEVDTNSFVINVSNGKNLKYNNILTITDHDTCMPYLQYNGIRYVTIDRLKYLYYRAVALKEVFNQIEEQPMNYQCLLSNILAAEKDYHKKHKKSKMSKFRRYVGKCDADDVRKIEINLMDMWGQKMKTLKKTKYIIDSPKENYITKIYPMPSEDLKLPYKPAEQSIKQHIKYHKDLKRKYKSLDKRKRTKKIDKVSSARKINNRVGALTKN